MGFIQASATNFCSIRGNESSQNPFPVGLEKPRAGSSGGALESLGLDRAGDSVVDAGAGLRVLAGQDDAALNDGDKDLIEAAAKGGRIPMTFGDLQNGERFRFRGLEYTKTARTMAEDGERAAYIFLEETEVERIEPEPPRVNVIPQ